MQPCEPHVCDTKVSREELQKTATKYKESVTSFEGTHHDCTEYQVEFCLVWKTCSLTFSLACTSPLLLAGRMTHVLRKNLTSLRWSLAHSLFRYGAALSYRIVCASPDASAE